MSDDTELVERLAAIDATPRASWVAGLRADLDKAWEIEDAGYLDSLRTTTVTVVDHEPSQSTSSRRWPILIIATAAAVVVAIALVTTPADDVMPADKPATSVTVAPTSPPRSLQSVFSSGENLVAGTYFVDEVDEVPTPRIFLTVGAGWYQPGQDPLFILNHGIGVVAFSGPASVPTDICGPSEGLHPGPVDTVDGLVAALTEQQGWAEVSAPTEISVDGYSGRAFQRTAPTEFARCETRRSGTRLSSGPVAHPDSDDYYEPGETETVWVLDIDGTVVLIKAGVWPGPSWAARADVAAAVLSSIRIDRSSASATAASEPNLSTTPLLPVGGREWGVGASVPDLGRFADQATLIDALVASGPLENQLLSDRDLRPGVSICADIIRFHEPDVGTLHHEATAVLNGQAGVVLVFVRPDGENVVRVYGTANADPLSACPLLMQGSLDPPPGS